MGKTNVQKYRRSAAVLSLMIPAILAFQNCSRFEVAPPEMLESLSSNYEVPPLSGSFNINGGAAFSKTQEVMLHVSPELGDELQVSEGPACLDQNLWIENAGKVSYELAAESGSHSLSLRGRKGATLSPCVTQKINIDLEAPHAEIKSGSATQIRENKLEIEFSGIDDFSGLEKTECQLDQGAWQVCVSPKSLASLSIGTHVFRLRATDKAGHVSTPKEHRFTYAAPTPVPTVSPTPTPVAGATPITGATPWPATIKIMPLGDSITEGGAIGGYRYYLWPLLTKAGYKIDYVGDYQNGHANLPDKNHQGVRGYRIDQVANGWQTYIDKHKPDIVLLGAGGNDISGNYKLDTAPQRLLELAKNIQSRNPKTWVIVQTRPPRTDALNAKVITFNAAVTALVNAETQKNPKIFLQDNYPLLTAADIYSDKVHPTYPGYEKLAKGWFSALKKILPAK